MNAFNFTEGMQINPSKVDWEFPWNFYSSKAQIKSFCPFKQRRASIAIHSSNKRLLNYYFTRRRQKKNNFSPLEIQKISDSMEKRSRSRHDYCCRMKRVINFLAAVSDKMTCCACDVICALGTRWWPILLREGNFRCCMKASEDFFLKKLRNIYKF
jgi:hypothetical protein